MKELIRKIKIPMSHALLELQVFDVSKSMASLLEAELWDKETMVHHIEGFRASPLHADDSDETVGAILGFMSLRPGDTDREFFEGYTPELLEWVMRYGEELSTFASILDGSDKETPVYWCLECGDMDGICPHPWDSNE